MKSAATHHAISTLLPEIIDPKGKSFVFQYEVKLQNLLECGGAYAKLLTKSANFSARLFDDKAPYTIMFGPDKCGLTNKIHFIFRHKNPITGKYEEKHLRNAPPVSLTKLSTLYTLVVQPTNDFTIYVNQEKVLSGNLLRDFEPAVNPPAEIEDPTDTKPIDWVDDDKIPDPKAKKPEDWDESAPMYIDDMNATMPEDWLVNEPLNVDDPEAKKPEDWNEEDDGKWIPRQIKNPACKKVSGCGIWTRPRIQNPEYKGKWFSPLIENPSYKGPWERRKVPNPEFFEDLHPCDFEPIGAIGFELWTMQPNILFDNIFIGYDEKEAFDFGSKTWAVKYSLEKALEKDAEKAAEQSMETVPFDYLEFILSIVDGAVEIIEDLKEDFVAGAQKHASVIISVLVTIVLVLFGFYKLVSRLVRPSKTSKTIKSETAKVKQPLSEITEDILKENSDDANSTSKTRKTKAKVVEEENSDC